MAKAKAKAKLKPGRVSEVMVAPVPATMAAGEFKARCLELMDLVSERQREIVITKRGKPVAKLAPVSPLMRHKPKRGFGALKGSFEIVGDIVGPVFDPDDFTFDEPNIRKMLE